MLERCSEATRHAMRNISDTFNGGDGGMAFAKLCMLVEAMDVKACDGDEAAAKVRTVILQFNRLIELAQSPR